MILTKDAILAATDLPRELVSVPEWGGDVYVCTMTGAERDQLELAAVSSKGGMKNVRAYIAALVLRGEDNTPMFTVADVEQLGQKSAAALDRIFEVAQRLNKLRPGDIEGEVKN